jgi:hypothetical protein
MNLRNALSNAFVGSGGGTFTGGSLSAQLIQATNGAASTPPVLLSGTIFTGGTATTTKPQLLIEPSGTTSTGWSTGGTGLGVNLATGFAGNLLDLQVNGSSKFSVGSSGVAAVGGGILLTGSAAIQLNSNGYIGDVSATEFGLCKSTFIGATYGLRLKDGAAAAWSSTSSSIGTPDIILNRSAAGILGLLGNATGAALEVLEMTAPSAPAANKARIFAQDNGVGKTQLMVIFPSGAAQQIAIEP